MIYFFYIYTQKNYSALEYEIKNAYDRSKK